MGILRAGITNVDITPPIGARLMGYGSRDHGAEGIHDPLHAQALVLDDGATRVGIVGCDLCTIREEQTAHVREYAASLCDIDPSHIMLCCSHTHGGPSMTERGTATGQKENIETTLRKLGGAVACSANNLREVKSGLGRGSVRMGMNRRELRDGKIVLGENPNGTIDPEVTVLRIDTLGGRPLAAVFNYACHGTTLGGDNYLITADYVGYARQMIERRIRRRGVLSLFVNGCAGDINPRPPRRTFMACKDRGHEVGEEAAKVWHKIKTKPEALLASKEATVRLPVAPPPTLAELKAMERDAAKQWRAAKQANACSDWRRMPLDWAREMIRRRTKGGLKRSIPVGLHAVRIGDLGIVGMPGEVLVEIGLQIKARSKFPHTIPAAYANGRQGYIPTKKAIAEGGYETTSHIWRREQPYSPSTEKALVTGAARLLNSLA